MVVPESRRTWWLSFVMLAALGGAWVLATPVFAAPDEPSHVIRAWSVAHGQFFGREFDAHHIPKTVNPVALQHVWDYGLAVRAPVTYSDWAKVNCLAYQPNATADCLGLNGDSRVAEEVTYHARYFPAYYFVVGLPSLITSPGSAQIYLMRFVGVLLAAALLASAVVSVRRTRVPSLAAAGLALALTPTALFLAAVVNPSGLEIAAAIAVWISGTLLARTAADGFDARLVDRLAIAAIALVVARPLGPLWLALAAAVLAVVAGTAGVSAIWRSRRARIWTGVIVVCTAVHVGWNLWQDAYDARHYAGTPSPLPFSEILRISTGKQFDLLKQMIGVFGWLDTPAPTFTLVIWLVGLGTLVGLAIALTSRRWTIALAVVVGLVVVVPILLEAWQVRDIGFQWQGRYTLPVAVGVPVLAAFAVAEDAPVRLAKRRIAVMLGSALAVAQILAFAQALRRYSVGANGLVFFFLHPVWEPPVPAFLLLVVYAVAITVFLGYVLLPRPWRGPSSVVAEAAPVAEVPVS